MVSLLKFLFGVCIIIAIGMVSKATQILPGSLKSAEVQLERHSEAALSALDASWASVELDGQKAVLTGEAPTADALAEATSAIAAADGHGGLVFGGVTAIDTTAVSVDDGPPIVSPVSLIAERSGNDVENISVAAPKTQPIIASEVDSVAAKREACVTQFHALIADQHITFAYARNTLGPISRAYLSDIADILSQCPGIVVEISGHSDSSGNTSRNLQLSLRRAEAAASHLRSIGVKAAQLRTRGVGAKAPRYSNSTAEGRAKNRRIEFDIVDERPQE